MNKERGTSAFFLLSNFKSRTDYIWFSSCRTKKPVHFIINFDNEATKHKKKKQLNFISLTSTKENLEEKHVGT